jgi:hypothetical protein
VACPVSKLEYNGFNKFVAFWGCGHVVSRKALKEVKLEQRACVVCQQPYREEDLIDLNLEPDRLELMRKALIERRKKKTKPEEDEEDAKPRKLVKEDAHLGVMDRLSGEFRDVIRTRESNSLPTQTSKGSSRRRRKTRTGSRTPTLSKTSRNDSNSL